MIQPSFKHRLTVFLMNAWMSKKHPLAWVLLPITAMYTLWAIWQKRRFQSKLAHLQHQLPHRPEIWVVGNLWVGGAGKTPLVHAIAEKAVSCGLRVGLISRGYGSINTQARMVHAHSSPSEVGDEPFWLAQATQLPVCVAADRARAMELLLQKHPDLDVVISDDGLLHPGLPRHREIVVLDERGLGNGWCIPSGPLRMPFDPQPFIQGAQRIWVMSRSTTTSRQQLGALGKLMVPEWCEVDRELAGVLRSLSHPERVINFSEIQSEKVGAFAGIAKPQIFFEMLTHQGLNLIHGMEYPDHQGPSVDSDHPWDDAQYWICTAKDAVKLHDFPQNIRHKIWVADLKLKVSSRLWKNLNLN